MQSETPIPPQSTTKHIPLRTSKSKNGHSPDSPSIIAPKRGSVTTQLTAFQIKLCSSKIHSNTDTQESFNRSWKVFEREEIDARYHSRKYDQDEDEFLPQYTREWKMIEFSQKRTWKIQEWLYHSHQ